MKTEHMTRIALGALVGAVLTTACTTTKSPTPPEPSIIVTPPSEPMPVRTPQRTVTPGGDAPQAYSGGTAPDPAIATDFLPFTDVGQLPFNQQINPVGMPLTGLYTRIRVMNDRKSSAYVGSNDPDINSGFGVAEDPRTARDYNEESRGWLSRRLGSRKVTRAFLVDFTLDEPDVIASTTLFSSSFESSTQSGESWATDENLATFATPYFRVGPNTVLSTTFKLKLASEGDADVGANVVAALNTAASLIAPTSPLITTFTAPQVTDASRFLDSSVSNLFGRSIEETTTSELALKAWTANPIFMIELNIPEGNNIKDGSRKRQAGKWAVYLDRPLISILMGASDPYELDFSTTTPARILSFRIGADLTVHDFVFARMDLSERINSLNDLVGFGDFTGAREEARKICTRVSRGLSDIGLNSVDIAIAWWAISQSEDLDTGSGSVMLEPDLCPAAENWALMAPVQTVVMDDTSPLPEITLDDGTPPY